MITLDTYFDPFDQDEEWRNKVAAELNDIIWKAICLDSTPLPDDCMDADFIKSALSIAERVAEFESIKTIGELWSAKPQRKKKCSKNSTIK